MSVLPTTQVFCMDDWPDASTCRAADRFVVQHVTASGDYRRPFVTTSDVPALRVSVSMLPIIGADHRLRFDGRPIRTRDAERFSSTILDLGGAPETSSRGAYEYLHFVMRYSALDAVAEDLGHARVGGIRAVSFATDLVLSRIAKSATTLFDGSGSTALALDHVELVLAAHLAQHYGSLKPRRALVSAGLPAWKRRRAAELIDAQLAGPVRLADLARECDLSVSHFARAFKASFGKPAHRWLLERRIDRAQHLLVETELPLVDIASRVGFRDQSVFTRTFRRLVGMPPGVWRRTHDTRARIV